MANSHVLIQSQTLGSAAATVTFNSIPGTYRDLFLVMQVGCSAAGNVLYVRVNGDTASTIPSVFMGGIGSGSGSSSTDSGTNRGFMGGFVLAGAPTGLTGNVQMSIFDYASTDKQKTSLSRANDAGSTTEAVTTRWPSTSAITSLVAFWNGGTNFITGSTFALYGVLG
jgi:hypothetical protein